MLPYRPVRKPCLMFSANGIHSRFSARLSKESPLMWFTVISEEGTPCQARATRRDTKNVLCAPSFHNSTRASFLLRLPVILGLMIRSFQTRTGYCAFEVIFPSGDFIRPRLEASYKPSKPGIAFHCSICVLSRLLCGRRNPSIKREFTV